MMATDAKVPTRSAFLNDLFKKDPKINPKQAEDAWIAAGYDGGISLNTFYNYKSEFNKKSAEGSGTEGTTAPKAGRKSSSKRTRAGKKAGPAATSTARANGRGATPVPEPEGVAGRARSNDRELDEIEDGIDDLIFRLKNLGATPEVVQALRRARRLLYSGPRG